MGAGGREHTTHTRARRARKLSEHGTHKELNIVSWTYQRAMRSLAAQEQLMALPPSQRKDELNRLAGLVRELGGADILEPQVSSSRRPVFFVVGALLVLLPMLRVIGFEMRNGDRQQVSRVEAHSYTPCAAQQQPGPLHMSGSSIVLPMEASQTSDSDEDRSAGNSRLMEMAHSRARTSKRIVLGNEFNGASTTARAVSGTTYPRPGAAPGSSSSYPAHDAFQHPRDALLKTLSHERNTSNFPLIVCIGQGKTATKSLNKAMVMLGMQTAHFYGAGVYGLLYDNAAEKSKHDFLFNVNEEKHVDAVLDTPVVEFYNEILLAFNAVILTIRGARSWLKSQQSFTAATRVVVATGRTVASAQSGLRNRVPVKGAGAQARPAQPQCVRQHTHDRLLVMDIPGGDGWDKLVPFLNSFMPRHLAMPPPNFTFPSRH